LPSSRLGIALQQDPRASEVEVIGTLEQEVPWLREQVKARYWSFVQLGRGVDVRIKILSGELNRSRQLANACHVRGNKQEIALVHVLEVGVTELALRRERFQR
jgi:hypothetical protein